MNRNLLVILLAVVLIGACGYAFFIMSQDTDVGQIDGDTEVVEAEGEKHTGPRNSIDRSSQKNPIEDATKDTNTDEAGLAQKGLAKVFGRAIKTTDQSPMAGMEVRITTIVGNPVATSETSEDGTFAVGNLPIDQELSFVLVSKGFASKVTPGLFLTKDQELDFGDVDVFPSNLIRGKVTSSGKNLAMAHVALLPNVSMNFANLDVVAILRNMTRDDDPLGLTQTDDSGNFSFENIVPGEYAVAVTADGKEFKFSEKISVLEGAALQEVEIDLLPGCKIKGTIKDPNGKPVANAFVAVLRDGGMGMPTVFKTLKTRSDENGAFEFTQLGKSRYNYMIRAAGYASVGDRFRVEAEKNKDLEIVMKKGITIKGKVTLEGSNKPVAGAEIITFEMDAPMSSETVSDADGNYELIDITPEGKLALIVKHEKYKLVIPKKKGRDFMPFAAIQVEIIGDEGPVITKNVTMFAGGTIKGQIIDQDTGKGIADAKVTVKPADNMGSFPFSAGGGVTVKSDANGDYVALGVRPGKFLIEAQKDGYYSDKPALPSSFLGRMGGALLGEGDDKEDPLANLPILENGATLSGQNLTLITGLTVKGRTFDPNDKPLPGATVKWSKTKTGDAQADQQAIFANMMSAMQSKPIISDKEGYFVIKGIRRAVGIDVKATHPLYGGGAKTAIDAAAVGKENIALTLQPGVRIYGLVTGPKGPVANLKISIRSSEQNGDFMEMMAAGNRGKPVTTDKSGRYSMDGLAGGMYRINVDSDDGYEVEGGNYKTIELVAGRDKEHNITLKPVAMVKGVVVDTTGKPIRNVQFQMTPEDIDPNSNERWTQMRWGNSNRRGEFRISNATEGVTYRIKATYNAPQDSDDGVASALSLSPDDEEEEGKTEIKAWTTLGGVKGGDLEVRIVLDITGLKTN